MDIAALVIDTIRLMRCEVCAGLRGRAGCTNGRCNDCHLKHCTDGGATSQGHGRGTVALWKDAAK